MKNIYFLLDANGKPSTLSLAGITLNRNTCLRVRVSFFCFFFLRRPSTSLIETRFQKKKKINLRIFPFGKNVQTDWCINGLDIGH